MIPSDWSKVRSPMRFVFLWVYYATTRNVRAIKNPWNIYLEAALNGCGHVESKNRFYMATLFMFSLTQLRNPLVRHCIPQFPLHSLNKWRHSIHVPAARRLLIFFAVQLPSFLLVQSKSRSSSFLPFLFVYRRYRVWLVKCKCTMYSVITNYEFTKLRCQRQE